jgi:hypothetical protein
VWSNTKLLKSAIFKPEPYRAGAVTWQLAQTFWVGGLWLLHFVVLPGLREIGLAGLLVDDLSAHLKPLLVAFALIGSVLQMVVLVQAEGVVSSWRDVRGQLLMAVLVLAGGYFALLQWAPQAAWWLQFNYLLLAFGGLLLVLQLVPSSAAIRARRARH